MNRIYSPSLVPTVKSEQGLSVEVKLYRVLYAFHDIASLYCDIRIVSVRSLNNLGIILVLVIAYRPMVKVCNNLGRILVPVSYTHLTLPTIYSV